MQVWSLLLVAVYCSAFLCSVGRGQMITQPPVRTTAALGTNATFTCHGDGRITWEVTGTQITSSDQLPLFAEEKVYAPLPTQSFSELIMTATTNNNFTRTVQCLASLSGIDNPVESEIVRLLVYAEPFPPSHLNIVVDGLSLIATWAEPFSIEGEEISYVVSIVNKATDASEEIIVETPRYTLTDPIDTRDCAEYEITVVSRNGYSRSSTGVSGMRNFPTEPLQLTTSDVSFEVSLSNGVRATITFSSSDPCPTYPVSRYTFNITERDSNNLITSITHTGTVPLLVDDSRGLGPNQIYQLVIESQNDVGSTLSEEILFYTTGLQSSTAVMELDGSITVTCTFAAGASSTGCQVTIFMMDGVQELVSRNITRSNEALQVTESIVISGLSMDSRLLVRTAELLNDGTVGSALFSGMVTVDVPTTKPPTTPPSTSTSGTVQATSNPTPFGSTFYFIIGAVLGSIVVLLLLIILTVCVIFSLRRKRNIHLFAGDDELKNNYSYGSSPVLTDTSRLENGGGIHARCNTYDYRDEQAVGMGPVYDTINEKSHVGNGASARPVPNPVYGGEVVHSGSKLATNPVYAEASEAQGRSREPTLLSQTSHTTDVSALNPVYSGMATPLSPLSLSGSYSSSMPQTQSVVPQPLLGGAADVQGDMRYKDDKLQYATPDQPNDRYTRVPQMKPELSPPHSPYPALAMAESEAKISYTKAPVHVVPTNPETGYSTLSRGDIVQPPPGPVPLYETIPIKDTRPPVRPDGDGVTLQSNKSYGLLMSESPNHKATPTPGSPTASGAKAQTSQSPPRPSSPHPPQPSHSPPLPNSPRPPLSPHPQEPPPPPSPKRSQSQTS